MELARRAHALYFLAQAEAAEAYGRTVGSPHVVAQPLTNIGVLHRELGEHTAAGSALREALRLAERASEGSSTVEALQALHALASASAAEGDVHRAAVLTAAFEALGGRGGMLVPAEHPAMVARLTGALAALDPVTHASAEAEGAAMTFVEAVAYALVDDRQTAGSARRADPVTLLSPRELEVARLIARGYTNRQIAMELIIAEPTAERHAANIFSKLGVHSRAQVAAWTVEHVHTAM